MSNLTVKGNASGTGTVILEAPNTNSNRTITLPDSTSTLATTADVGTGLTLLGTITTTSGSSVSLSGLTLTSYKQLQVFVSGVSGSATASTLLLNSQPFTFVTITSAATTCTGGGIIDLASGIFFASSAVLATSSGDYGFGYGGASGLTTASTSITFTISTGTFDAGSIRIYGVK